MPSWRSRPESTGSSTSSLTARRPDVAARPDAASLAADLAIEPYLSFNARAGLAQRFPSRPGRPPLSYAVAEETVRQLRAAGVPILAGADAPNPGTAHGASMHHELELLVAAGLSPVEALAAATIVPAKVFRLDDRSRIAPGLRADLVLVDGDPTGDIRATRRIAGVWKSGVAFDRAAYGAEVARANAAVGRRPEGLEHGVVSDFENGTLAAPFGTEWIATSDAMAGGRSTGTVEVVAGGAEGSARPLRIAGGWPPLAVEQPRFARRVAAPSARVARGRELRAGRPLGVVAVPNCTTTGAQMFLVRLGSIECT